MSDRMSNEAAAARIAAQADKAVAGMLEGSALPRNYFVSQVKAGRGLDDLKIPTQQRDFREPNHEALPVAQSGRYFAKVVPGRNNLSSSESSILDNALNEARLAHEKRMKHEKAKAAAEPAVPARSIRPDATDKLSQAELRELHARIVELDALDGRLNQSLGQLSLSKTLATEGRGLEDLTDSTRSPTGSFRQTGKSRSDRAQPGACEDAAVTLPGSPSSFSRRRDEDGANASSVVRAADVESFADLRREEQRWNEEEIAYSSRSRSWLLPPGTSLRSLFMDKPEC